MSAHLHFLRKRGGAAYVSLVDLLDLIDHVHGEWRAAGGNPAVLDALKEALLRVYASAS